MNDLYDVLVYVGGTKEKAEAVRKLIISVVPYATKGNVVLKER